MKARHGLTQADLDCLVFLSDEGVFDTSYFLNTIFKLIPFEINRLYRLIDEGWLQFANNRVKFDRRQQFRVSSKGHSLVRTYYRLLEGDEELLGLPAFAKKDNPFTAKDERLKYRDRQAKKFYRDMREELRKKKFK